MLLYRLREGMALYLQLIYLFIVIVKVIAGFYLQIDDFC
jgi:hypothetical protein